MNRHRAKVARSPSDANELTWQTRCIRVIPVTAALVIVAIGLLLAIADHWRKGSAALALAAALAAALRLLLPARFAGVLAVRSRVFDVLFLLAVTGLLGAMALAVVVPGH